MPISDAILGRYVLSRRLGGSCMGFGWALILACSREQLAVSLLASGSAGPRHKSSNAIQVQGLR